MHRRDFLKFVSGAGAAALAAPRTLRAMVAPPVTMTVYKSPSCGCCHEWVKHVEKNGFAVKVVDMTDVTPAKRTAGVPEKLESCHTALVGPYVIEGHVPADLIQKMLREKPAILGLAVAGMVVGSPGMEQGSMKQAYDVTAFTRDGRTSVYARR
jgi:hypothetical protein